jgi:hypothetical protein
MLLKDPAAPPEAGTDASQLEKASLSRAPASVARDETRAAGGKAPLLSISIFRHSPAIPRTGDYFKLKMLLVRKLRRGFKTAVIQVDDAEGAAPEEAPFQISLEPSDSEGIERATKVVQRVLRSRHWRAGRAG